MIIVGVGTDLVAVARFARLIDRGGLRFLLRWFSAPEADYCLAKQEPARHAAARFAAKEATFKSLRLPGTGPARWREIEVVTDSGGRPGLQLHGSFRERAADTGIAGLHVSLSHDASYATATVVALAHDRRSSQPPVS